MLLRAIEEKRSCRSAPTARRRATSSSSPAPTAISAPAVARGPLPRGPARAHQPLDLPAAGPRRAARGHRAQPRLRARAGAAATRRARDLQPRGARAVPRVRGQRRRPLDRQLPRPQRRRDPHGDARARRPHHASTRSTRRSRGSGARGPARRARSGRRVSWPGAGAEEAAELDRFDRVQLEDVLGCAGRRHLSAAGRALFASSRGRKKSVNDADRLRKYLARFGLEWETARRAARAKEQG